MLYVLGFRDYELVKIDITWGEYLNQTKNAESLLSFTFLSGRVYYDVGNHRATFYQNKEDAVKILNTLKENSRKVRVLSRIDSLLDDSAEPFYSLDELRVYCLTATPIELEDK